MSKKWSQFDVAASIAGDESFVGLKDGDNAQFPFADILSYFQSEIDDNFWPLSGSAALTNDLDIDGAFDLIFGSITPLTNVAFYINGEFNVDADQVVLRAQDGTDLTELVFDESFFALTTQGVSYVSIDSEVSVGLSADDGVDSSSLTIDPTKIAVIGPFELSSYAVAGVPDPTLFDGCLIYITNETGGKTPAWSNGVTWNRIYDGNPIST